ncbi:unnamed protein product [Ranitomeya imitator]|uniref:Protein kinase domain-containing protein n=1 Tax=Ranitomeya imitator TaxID=111125 RepID=A0ABN9MAD8_9NEOB|nr:unnamed protein product [Ranitomeya imitator]
MDLNQKGEEAEGSSGVRPTGSKVTVCDTDTIKRGLLFHHVVGQGSFGTVLLAEDSSTRKHFAVKIIGKRALLAEGDERVMVERRVLQLASGSPFLFHPDQDTGSQKTEVVQYFMSHSRNRRTAGFQVTCSPLTPEDTVADRARSHLRYPVKRLELPVVWVVSYQQGDRENRYVLLGLEYVSCGDFNTFLLKKGQLDIPSARFCAVELVCGIQYLHSKGIIHRDLKPENILVAEMGHIKITDVGLTIDSMHGDRTATEYGGTPGYMAPEIFPCKEYNAGVDYDSFGVILKDMVTSECTYHLTLDEASSDTDDITKQLLEKDPARCSGVHGNIRQHVFFQCIDWVSVEALKVPPPHIPVTSPGWKKLSCRSGPDGKDGKSDHSIIKNVSVLPLRQRLSRSSGDTVPERDEDLIENDLLMLKVKTRWRSMKDRFNKGLRQESRVPSGSGARIRNYKYHRILAFLRPVLGQRTSWSSTLDPGSGEVLHQTATDPSQPSSSPAASGPATQTGDQEAGPSGAPLSQSSASFLGGSSRQRQRASDRSLMSEFLHLSSVFHDGLKAMGDRLDSAINHMNTLIQEVTKSLDQMKADLQRPAHHFFNQIEKGMSEHLTPDLQLSVMQACNAAYVQAMQQSRYFQQTVAAFPPVPTLSRLTSMLTSAAYHCTATTIPSTSGHHYSTTTMLSAVGQPTATTMTTAAPAWTSSAATMQQQDPGMAFHTTTMQQQQNPGMAIRTTMQQQQDPGMAFRSPTPTMQQQRHMDPDSLSPIVEVYL